MTNKETEELISVIVPVYNVEKYIKKCIDSILRQTYCNIEIILIDDESKDKSGIICDQYAKIDNRIKVIHKENTGISDVRNLGIKLANGKYITFIDSDDYVEDDYVEFLYNLIIKNNVKISITSHTAIYNTGLKLQEATNEFSVIDSKTAIERTLYEEGINISPWGKMYEKTVFDKVQYPVSKNYEDTAVTCKLFSQVDKVAIGSVSKYYYIIREDSISRVKDFSQKMDLITCANDMGEYILKQYPDLGKAVNRRIMYAYLSTLSQLANLKERHPKEQKEIMTYINTHRKQILEDERIPSRDRKALEITKLGFNVYKIFWHLYKKKTNRE